MQQLTEMNSHSPRHRAPRTPGLWSQAALDCSCVLVALSVVFAMPLALTKAQEAAGGSIKDFKKPANPPVYGGKIPKGPKNSSTSKPETEDPAATKARDDATASKKPLGAFGSLKGGVSRSPAPTTTAARPAPAPPPPPAPTPALAASAVNKDLEDAIAAGNDARSADPANYDEAEKAYRLAAKIAPTDVRPYEGLGN